MMLTRSLLAACALAASLGVGPAARADDDHAPAKVPPLRAGESVAIFAGGCFWCMTGAFEKLPGVRSVLSGYTGGKKSSPTYHEVGGGGTGHAEAIRVVYDPQAISYERLLHVFWRSVDPTDAGGQFCDRGDQYRPAIFVYDDEQRRAAVASKSLLTVEGKLPGPIVVPVVDAGPFWPAENYHQRYHLKNPRRYALYRLGCGRDRRLEQLWGAEAQCACHGGH